VGRRPAARIAVGSALGNEPRCGIAEKFWNNRDWVQASATIFELVVEKNCANTNTPDTFAPGANN